MSTIVGANTVFRPFGELLAKDDAGEAELEQIFCVLLQREEYRRSKGKSLVTPTRLGPGEWIADRTLGVCLPLVKKSEKDNDGKLLIIERMQESQLRGRITQVIVTDPYVFAGSGLNADKDLQQLTKGLQKGLSWKGKPTVWDAQQIKELLLTVLPLGLRYYPEFIHSGPARRQKIEAARLDYDREFAKLHGKIQFVGMSVYKEEASASVEMDKIYIPLQVVPEGAVEDGPQTTRMNPLRLLAPGEHHVILGDPGSGKSTLLRFLALAGNQPRLRQQYNAPEDDRLPILVTLRRFADELKARPDLSLVEYMVELARGDFSRPEIDIDFLEYFLLAGRALVFLDGLDELPSSDFKLVVREKVSDFLLHYPGNTVIVTSRIVGYDKEVRYDKIGFSHHRVARLSLLDIKNFIQNWYGARIENRSERERHVQDLARIVSDPDHRSIRDLAENPLLLTIICLVHRIDAVLPDERVVLYQKCTETLLNTWHAWKFQSEQPRSRNKVERRNRARMEALAYWMHCLFEQEGEKQRAVVPYSDILDFLAQYIAEIEKPPKDEPRVLAEEFLRFVKERAGLLIEAGDQLYSFVHLTFQEYLTATYLRKSGEAGGMSVIWDLIKKRCGNSRWHEVIRLLIGSMERVESQKYLLKCVVPKIGDKDYLSRALVAGGCLIDSIDAAEEMQDVIVESLLRAAVMADSVETFRGPLNMLRVWREREDGNRKALAQVAQQLIPEMARQSGSHGKTPKRGRSLPVNAVDSGIALALTLAALGLDDREIVQIDKRPFDQKTRAGQIYTVCIAEQRPATTLLSEEEQELFRTASSWSCVRSPFLNFTGMALSSLSIAESQQPCPPFSQLLLCLTAISGPFLDQVLNCSMSSNFETGPRYFQNRDQARARAQALTRARDQARARARAQALAQARARAQGGAFWQAILDDAGLHSFLVDLVCDLLALAPRPHWWEVLRLRWLPRVPERITLTNPQVWKRTEEAFAQHRASETDCLHAASQLLVDVWL